MTFPTTRRRRLIRRTRHAAAGAVLLLSATTALAGIIDLGLPSGAAGLRAAGISANGQVVTGATFPSDSRAIQWSAVEGVQYLTGQAGTTGAIGTAANGDGSVIVGSRGTSNPALAFRWTAAGGMVSLGSLPGSTNSFGTGVSADGNIVTGYARYSSSGDRAFRWTAASGLQQLVAMPGHAAAEAFGISGNGEFVVGNSTNSVGEGRLVRWNTAGVVEDLGALPQFGNHEAYGASFDGSVVVGRSGVEAVRWTDLGGLQALARPAGVTSAVADAVNGNGSVIAGRLSRVGGPYAMMWTQSTGMVDLNQYLPTIGFDVTGWNLQAVTGVSADGMTLTGYGSHNAGARGWVVTIPSPGAAAIAGTGGTVLVVRRRRR